MQAKTPEPIESADLAPGKRVRASAVRFSPELFTELCDRIAEGHSLRQVCKAADMPVKSSVLRWLGEKPELRAQYALAHDMQHDTLADEIIEIADDGSLDTIPGTNKHGVEVQVSNPANVQRDRLRVDARKWSLSKLAPKKYGDKIEHEHTGEVQHTHAADLSTSEKLRRFALFMLEDQAAGELIEGETVATPANADNAGL